jgi:predicted 2-oxoglutarate/Fe(II)-dependent dioxygenase YbiX
MSTGQHDPRSPAGATATTASRALTVNAQAFAIHGGPLLSPEQCSEIVRNAESADPSHWRQAGVGSGAGVVLNPVRRIADFLPLASLDPDDVIAKQIFDHLGAVNRSVFRFHLGGVPEFDRPTVLRYTADAGGHHDHHSDSSAVFPTRKLSFTVQLSDPDSYTGGDLEFLNADGAVARRQGDIVIFPAFMVHRVSPVVLGTRHSLVGWVHGHTFT